MNNTPTPGSQNDFLDANLREQGWGWVWKAMLAHYWEHSLPMWRGFKSRHRPHICGLSLLLVLSFALRGFSPGSSGFPLSSKPILSKSSSICSAPSRLNQFSKTAKCFVGKHLQLQKSVCEFAFIMLGFVLVLFYRSTAEDVVSVSFDQKNREVTGLHTLINNQKVIQSRILFLSHKATCTTHLQYKHHEKECFI